MAHSGIGSRCSQATATGIGMNLLARLIDASVTYRLAAIEQQITAQVDATRAKVMSNVASFDRHITEHLAQLEDDVMPTLRVYDLRHTCITRLLSNPDVSERVVIETVGHVNNNMLQRYSHQRFEDKAKALDTLAPAFDFLGMVQA
jgi:integrase